ncbi:hypothetical protein [Microbulbifer yueqingensis]|uniref:Uncharacterized protein n=1 Tax=Microbulbifer yueqingensis TaxID=658219 RepID=A0A1G8Y1Y2_9GAMM|nr:hypothetical protein [Microbulbifer yueqingensis]SDJ96786.1 hypothetical protein SAMN05216212_1326 [Microbulbifer yueqingensis]
MYRFTARALLLLMLVTVFGQVAAQACVDMHGQLPTDSAASAESSTSSHHEMNVTTGTASMDHCGDGPMGDTAESGHCADPAAASEECGQECTCCPGHCASAVPLADQRTATSLGAVPESSYLEIASSAPPESEFRPPINP